jgi:hypothetical protein
MTDVAALRELLERAVQLEGEVESKADAGTLETSDADELRTQVAELKDQLHALTDQADEPEQPEVPDPGDDDAALDEWIATSPDDDDEDPATGGPGMDFDVPDDAPADADLAPETADGEEPADDGEKGDGDLEVKVSDELEELLARRLALDLGDVE